MTGPLKLTVFVALCAIMFVIVIATEGNPLVVIAVILAPFFSRVDCSVADEREFVRFTPKADSAHSMMTSTRSKNLLEP